MYRVFFAALILLGSLSLSAYDPNAERVIIAGETPKELDGVGINENLGGAIDLNLEFTSDTGETVKLAKYFNQEKPVLMAMVYYGCPNLCNYQMNGITDAMKQMKLRAGKDYEFVAISIHPGEDDLLASEKKAAHIDELGRHEEADGWHLLTGTAENIKQLADQFGFGFKWLEKSEQYSHAAATYIMTPKGIISRYLYGVTFDAKTLSFSLIEASNNMIGDIIDRIVLFCFQFDPTKSKYTLYAYNIMRVGALLVLFGLAIFLVPFWLRERRATEGEG